jgi:hypothetical protein
MTAKEAAELIGKVGMIIAPGLGIGIDVEILDVKTAYGKTRYQVKPWSGTGDCWVEKVNHITTKGGH